MELFKATPINNGLNIRLESVPLLKNELPYVDSCSVGQKSKQNTFACQFITNDIDLKNVLKDENYSYITVVFSCTHVLSSIRKKFVYHYHLEDISDGEFEKGKSLNVRKN